MMKKLLIILTFCLSAAKAQTVPAPQLTFSTVADLRAQGANSNGVMASLSGLVSADDQNGGIYKWNSTSTATDDGFITIKVANITTGRWVRIGNGNTIKGSISFLGALGVTSYTVNYTQGSLPFVPITVLVTPRTSSGSYGYYIPTNGITNSGFTISYNPTLISILGALTGQNIVFDYIVVKQ